MLVTEIKKITDRRNKSCLEDGTSFFGSNIKDCSGSIGLLEELVEKTRY